MASVKFFLDKRKGPKKDGTYLLKLCIIHERKVKYVSLNLSLKDVAL
ncbi:MAG: hypothetical protein J1E63_05480 [Muribaculaceae bacterium]|nr:hypothetical protein [Muribaculaceae bacterium]